MADERESTQDVDLYAPPAKPERFVHMEVADTVVTVQLNRPPANVLSLEMLDELDRSLEKLDNERQVKLVVLRGGDKYFSAGFELGDHLGDRAYTLMEGFRFVIEDLQKLDKPLLAVVAGSALGAGCVLAAACDMVLAAQSAKFAQPEIKGGVFNPVAAALLPRLVGRKRAYELLLSGAALTATEAEKLGLITRAVPDDRLEAEVQALVARFQEGSAPVLQLVRRAIVGGLDLAYEQAVRHAEDVYLNQLIATEDAVEGLRAVAERRKPEWKNK